MNPDGSVRDHFNYGPEGCQAFAPWRCIIKPVEWNGEGLPPIGADVECTFAVEEKKFWHRGTVAYRGVQPEGDDFIVVKTDQFSACYREGGGMVRPYRTPEQVEADERTKAVDEMWSVYWQPDAPTAKEALGLLYDAGYRKQVAL